MPLIQPSTLEHLLILYARRFPIRRGKLRVINALWRAATGNQGTTRLATLKHGGLKMQCDLTEMLQRQLYFFGTYFLEEQNLDCWADESIGAKVVFDVGANVGIYSLAALAVQRDLTVHAFEPTPEIAVHLRETATLNRLDHLHVHQVAVFSDSGHASLRRFRGELGTNGGMNFITTAADDPGVERVPTVSLDSFCAEHEIARIDLLKIDIQGQEHRALAGAAHLLNTARIGTIFTELNWAQNNREATCPATESIRILEKAGYRFSKPVKPLHWKSSGEWLRSLSDVVASRDNTEQLSCLL
jgi:FkbM family methyltransferase